LAKLAAMSDKPKQKVIVMMSGGVDSSVAALLLKKDGNDVEGVFMKNWSPNNLQSLTDCPWKQDLKDAEAVAKQLDIPFRSVNFEKEYRSEVVDYFLREYKAGRTPNPDVMCNKAIKFGAFYKWARKQGADFIATGHYARIFETSGQKLVSRGIDKNKDQSYFLWAIKPEILKHTIFPIGELKKTQVRQIAKKAKLKVANKKDSQGICFIGHINLAEFLQAELGTKEGLVKTIKGSIVGRHSGAHILTIGQRHGFEITNPKALAKDLNLDATNLPPLFVIAKDIEKNEIIIGSHSEVELLRDEFIVKDVIWHQKPNPNQNLKVQIRYRGVAIKCTVVDKGRNIIVKSVKKIRALAPGQFAVFYQSDNKNEFIVGGGTIVE